MEELLFIRAFDGAVRILGFADSSSAKADILINIKNALLSREFNSSFFDEDGYFSARIYAGGKLFANAYTTPWIRRSYTSRERLVLDIKRFGRFDCQI